MRVNQCEWNRCGGLVPRWWLWWRLRPPCPRRGGPATLRAPGVLSRTRWDWLAVGGQTHSTSPGPWVGREPVQSLSFGTPKPGKCRGPLASPRGWATGSCIASVEWGGHHAFPASHESGMVEVVLPPTQFEEEHPEGVDLCPQVDVGQVVNPSQEHL